MTAPTLDLLTPAEVADELQLHYQTIYVWIRSGQLPSIRLGRRLYISRAALAEYVEASARPATAGPLAGKY